MARHILLLSGLAVQTPLLLPDGVQLVPLDAIPPECVTGVVAGWLRSSERVDNDRANLVQIMVPSGALLWDGPAADTQRLKQACFLLSVLPSCCPAPLLYVQTAGQGWGGQEWYHEYYSFRQYAPSDDDRTAFKEVYTNFVASPPALKEKIITILERFVHAKCRPLAHYRAMDLVTVLESLILNDLENPTTEITFRLRLRGAWLLGETVEGRADLFKFLGRLYGTRSKLVHRGAIIHKRFAFRGNDIVSLGQLADQPERICEAIVTKLIERRAMLSEQEWKELVLGR